jgi:hypothetical protein
MEDASTLYSKRTPDKEIQETRSQDIIMTSEFPKHRAFVSRAFKDAIANILDEYSPDNNIGIEYGCGSSAYLFTMLPDRFKANWKLYDGNPQVVDCANSVIKHLGYNNVVEQGDIYSISRIHNDVPLIMGLSSWDDCYNLENAVEEVYKALSEKGVFIHIQDLYPSKNVVLGREWKRRYTHGMRSGFIEYETYKTDEWCVVGIKSIIFGWISSIIHFLVELSDACRKVGFKEVDWGYGKGSFTGEKLQVHRDVPDKNVFTRIDADYLITYDEKLSKKATREKIDFLVLTAKK